jgi:hypothetical protein
MIELVEMHLRNFCRILCLFFEQTARRDGWMYPAGTLMNLLQTMGRVLRRAQEVRVMSMGIHEPPCNIKESVVFKKACLACVITIERSQRVGVGVIRKKVGQRWCFFFVAFVVCGVLWYLLVRFVLCGLEY